MRLRNDVWLVAVFVAAAVGCDDPYAEIGDSDTGESPAKVAPKVDAPRRAPVLEYEDAEDFAVLNDRSNLRPSDVSPLEHRRRLDLRFRQELLQEMDGVTFPTQEEIAALSMRWFAAGTGVFVQNPTLRPFTVSAYFSATAEPTCGQTVGIRAVLPGESVMLSPLDPSECVLDRADVTLTDEYGFFVDRISVEAEERKP